MRTRVRFLLILTSFAVLALAGCAAQNPRMADPLFGGYHRAGNSDDLTSLITERKKPVSLPVRVTRSAESDNYADRNYRNPPPQHMDTTEGDQYSWIVNYNLYGPNTRRGGHTRFWYDHMYRWPDVPWYSSGWVYHDPWWDYYPYYGYWDWGSWYDPWYGYYDPWYGYHYGTWHSYYDPWYGYYDPWAYRYHSRYHRYAYRHHYWDPYWHHHYYGSTPRRDEPDTYVQRTRSRKDQPSALPVEGDALGSRMTGAAQGGSNQSSGAVSRPEGPVARTRDTGSQSSGSPGRSTGVSSRPQSPDRSSTPSVTRSRSSSSSKSSSPSARSSSSSSSRSSSGTTKTSRTRRRNP